MYLTVCPPRGPGHNRLVVELIHLIVCPLCSQGNDSTVGVCILLSVLSVAWVMTYKRLVSWLIMLGQLWALMGCRSTTERHYIA